MVYGVQQTKLFVHANVAHATMASFACKLEGLPIFKGHEQVEEKLKVAVTAATGVQPVAVSVAWDYGTSKHTVDTIMEQEMEEDHGHAEGPPEETSALGKAEAWATNQAGDSREFHMHGEVLNAWHVHLEHHHVSTEVQS